MSDGAVKWSTSRPARYGVLLRDAVSSSSTYSLSSRLIVLLKMPRLARTLGTLEQAHHVFRVFA